MGMKGGSAMYGERGMRGWECSVWREGHEVVGVQRIGRVAGRDVSSAYGERGKGMGVQCMGREA